VTAHGTTPHQPIFAGDVLAKLEALYPKYPDKRSVLLPALWLVQEARGWVSDDAVREVAERLDLTPSYVRGVLTFYTMYHKHPVGRHFIQVCTTSPCGMCGAEDVARTLVEHSGCGDLGATSPDGRFTVIEVECLGACGFPTPILIDDDFIESVTPERVPELLARYP
jgi:NADH-quinone oxidoreductase E subunit